VSIEQVLSLFSPFRKKRREKNLSVSVEQVLYVFFGGGNSMRDLAGVLISHIGDVETTYGGSWKSYRIV
jgi:hypothetical protein